MEEVRNEENEVFAGEVVELPVEKKEHSIGDALIGAGVTLAVVGLVKGAKAIKGKVQKHKEEAGPKKKFKLFGKGKEADDEIEMEIVDDVEAEE